MVEWLHEKSNNDNLYQIISFRKDTSAIFFEKFDDIEIFLEFDEQLRNNEEKFRELVSVIWVLFNNSSETHVKKTERCGKIRAVKWRGFLAIYYLFPKSQSVMPKKIQILLSS